MVRFGSRDLVDAEISTSERLAVLADCQGEVIARTELPPGGTQLTSLVLLRDLVIETLGHLCVSSFSDPQS